ncbi:uncharacterized protein TNCV_4279911 [Trichonephila clavipes]|nr:uncharacterized protein TNCV_4279911 [Trichonephila clavipes]
MVPHTITPALEALCHCKAKTRLRGSAWALHTRTRLPSLLTLNLDSSLSTTWFRSTAVQIPRARHNSKRRRRRVGIKVSTGNGHFDRKCSSVRRLRMVREDTGPSIKGATCAWMAAEEAVGSTLAFITMIQSSRRLVY